MQIAKYTSTKEIINNFMRNTAYNEHVNLGDMAYWVYEAMELIGFPLQYIPKVIGHKNDSQYMLGGTSAVPVTNATQEHPAEPHTHLTSYETSTTIGHYKVELPCDFHKLMAVSVDGVMAVPASSLFHHLIDSDCCGDFTDSNPPELFYDNFGNVFSPQALPLNIYLATNPPSFTINNNFMTFNVKEGKVCMAYWAFPLDDEGFPLIPDDIKYKRAVSSYLQYRMDYIMWRQDLLTDKVYVKSEQDWMWNVASASSHLKTPDLNQMEAMRRQFTKMIVRNQDFRTGFANISLPGYRGRY